MLLNRLLFTACVVRRVPAAFANEVLVNSAVAREMVGNITRMTLHIWMHGLAERRVQTRRDPLYGFPRPVKIRGRNYWRRSELEQWVADRTAERISERI